MKIDNNVKLDNKVIEKIVGNFLDNFDYDYGGFGMQPKFPMTDAINLAFNQYNKSKNKDYLIIARVTLDNMKGIFDNIEIKQRFRIDVIDSCISNKHRIFGIIHRFKH